MNINLDISLNVPVVIAIIGFLKFIKFGSSKKNKKKNAHKKLR